MACHQRLLFLLLILSFQGIGSVGDASASTSSTSTQCPESGLFTAYSQEEVDAFAENYPECEQLTSLKVLAPSWVYLGYENPDPVVSIAAFQQLREVAKLTISGSHLVSFEELENLSDVRAISVNNNEFLTSIALPNTLRVSAVIEIYSNPVLSDLGSLAESDSSNRFNLVTIFSNPTLEDCTVVAPFLGYPDKSPYQKLRQGWRIENNGEGCASAIEILSSIELQEDYRGDFAGITRCDEPDGGFLLSSQDAIDSFQENYGPCNAVNKGSLTIEGLDIVNLDGLSELEYVNALFLDTPALEDISGLQNLVAMQWLNISEESFEGVQNAEFSDLLIMGTFFANSNEGHEGGTRWRFDTALFPNLRYADQIIIGPNATNEVVANSKLEEFCSVRVYDSDLTDLSFLTDTLMPSCIERYGSSYTSSISLERNDALIDTSALQTLQVEEDLLILTVNGSPQLTALYAPSVPSGSEIGLGVNGTSVTQFYNFDAFTSAGHIYLDRNLDYPTGSILPNVRRADSLGIVMESGASSANWFPALEELGALDLIHTEFAGPSRLKKVHDRLRLISPKGSLSGLNGVTSIGQLTVDGSKLETLNFLESIETVGLIQLLYNNNLTDLSALSGVHFDSNFSGYTYEGNCWDAGPLCVLSNDQLRDLPLSTWYRSAVEGFENRDILGKPTVIEANASLEQLQVFQGVSKVGPLRITDNDSLENLNDLTTLNDGWSLEITGNDALSDCRGLAPLLGWPSGPSNLYDPFTGEAGTIDLSGNNVDCGDPESILDSVVGPTQPTINSIKRLEDDAIIFSFTESVAGDDLFPLENHQLSCDGTSYETDEVSEAPITNFSADVPIHVSGLGTLLSEPQIEVGLRVQGYDFSAVLLTYSLISPEGVTLPLWDRTLHSTNKPFNPMTPLIPVPHDLLLDGTWTLSVRPPPDIIEGMLTGDGSVYDLVLKIDERVIATSYSRTIESAGFVQGRDYDCKISPITKLGAIPASDPFSMNLASIPFSVTTIFKQLLDSVLSITQTSGNDSSIDSGRSRPPQARAGEEEEEKPNAIPTLPMLGLFILSGLLGLFGIRRLAHR